MTDEPHDPVPVPPPVAPAEDSSAAVALTGERSSDADPAPPASSRWATPPPAVPWDRPQFDQRWPGRDDAADRTVLLAVGAGGLAAAVTVPFTAAGVGWLVAALNMLVALLIVGWRASRNRKLASVTRIDVAWAVTAVALAAVASIRASGELDTLCVLAAVAAAGLAADGRRHRGALSCVREVGWAGLTALPWLERGLARAGWRWLAAGITAALGLALFVPPLIAANGAFAQLVEPLLPGLDPGTVLVRAFLFGLGAVAVAGACVRILAPPPRAVRPWRLIRPGLLEWAVPAGVLFAVVAVYVGAQIGQLLGSADSAAGVTSDEYAGSDDQALLINMLVLGVLGLGARVAPRQTRPERMVTRVLLAAFAVLGVVLVASALHRTWLDQQAYGLTGTRLFVLTAELWLGVGMLIVLVAVLRLRPANLRRSMVATGMLALLGVAVLNPDGFVAEHDVARWVATGEIDTHYLSRLSVDAVPALRELPEPMRSCVLGNIAPDPHSDPGWRSATLADARADAVFAELDIVRIPKRPLVDRDCG